MNFVSHIMAYLIDLVNEMQKKSQLLVYFSWIGVTGPSERHGGAKDSVQKLEKVMKLCRSLGVQVGDIQGGISVFLVGSHARNTTFYFRLLSCRKYSKFYTFGAFRCPPVRLVPI